MKREFDDLYETDRPVGGWYANTTVECQEWIRQLAEDIQERGRVPVWVNVHRAVRQLFPTDAPKTPDTVKAAIVTLLDA